MYGPGEGQGCAGAGACGAEGLLRAGECRFRPSKVCRVSQDLNTWVPILGTNRTATAVKPLLNLAN